MVKEIDNFYKSGGKASYYAERLKEVKTRCEQLSSYRQVVKAEAMPWELCREGKLKHVCNEKTDTWMTSFDVYLQEIPPAGYSGRHRHMREEAFFVLEGKGYDIHHDPDLHLKTCYEWDISKEAKRFDWAEGDLVYIPVMVAHQHFNADPNKRVRIIVCNPRYPAYMGCETWEQLADASNYKP
ncbi:MAG: cupin domain-containing protein [Chloroflexi bacterium]|nr:cupin domain-containing protein [Chloroflexota bacterium]